jgi:serine/threonine protein phosphatase PrpC
MEDAHATVLKLDDNRWSHWSYFGIFDGHAGYRTAVKAAEKLHLRLVSCLNILAQEQFNGKSPLHITSSQFDFNKLEMSIKDAYFKFDNEWREENRNNNTDDKSGSTAISCLIDPERIYFLNVGDSRGILVSTEGRILLATKDHKPSRKI